MFAVYKMFLTSPTLSVKYKSIYISTWIFWDEEAISNWFIDYMIFSRVLHSSGKRILKCAPTQKLFSKFSKIRLFYSLPLWNYFVPNVNLKSIFLWKFGLLQKTTYLLSKKPTANKLTMWGRTSIALRKIQIQWSAQSKRLLSPHTTFLCVYSSFYFFLKKVLFTENFLHLIIS